MTARRRLTICAVGSASSPHVAARVRCFAERGHRVFLVSELRAGIDGVTELVPRETVEANAIVRVLDWFGRKIAHRPLRGMNFLSLLIGFPRLVRQCRPDIVHVHFAYSVWAWMSAVVACHPLVVSVMGGDVLFDEQGNPTARGRWLTRELLREADLITTKSHFLTRALERLDKALGAKAIRVVWGVDVKQFRRIEQPGLRARLGLGPEHAMILSAKILQPFYNIHLVVEAMPRVLASVPHAVLVVTEYAADQDYKREIVRRVHELGLQDRVRFVGHVAHGEMPAYYSAADVAVAVPSSDGLPQTLLESMACGAPNVVSRLPHYAELLAHAENAYFVDRSPASIAEGLVRVLLDRPLRERIERGAAETVESHANLEREAERVEAQYYELLAAPPARRPALRTRARMLYEIVRYWLR